jgi:hypothetical protein
MRKLILPAVAAFALLSHRGLCQTSGDKATAEGLFTSGRKLMAAGNYAEACPKLAASQKLDPGVGTMLNLADCYEKSGQTASAWAVFRETISAARSAGSKDREQLARDRAQALESKLSRITISVAPGQASTVHVTRDGVTVDPAALGTPLPIDPGKHVIEATAPGKKKWSEPIDVGTSGSQISVSVPALADAPASTTATSTDIDVGAASSKGGGGAQRGVAIAVGALGVAGVVVGTAFGLKAKGDWSDAKAKCSAVPNGCTTEAVGQGSDAKSAANLSTVGFVVGALGLAGGAVLWFTAPKGERGLALGVGPTSVSLTGAFQ